MSGARLFDLLSIRRRLPNSKELLRRSTLGALNKDAAVLPFNWAKKTATLSFSKRFKEQQEPLNTNPVVKVTIGVLIFWRL